MREHQLISLKHTLVDKQDGLIVLPTSMGKSLAFEALTFTNSLLNGSKQDMVLVVSPLRFLIDMQVAKLNKIGLSAVSLCTAISNKITFKEIVDGKYR